MADSQRFESESQKESSVVVKPAPKGKDSAVAGQGGSSHI